MFKPEKMKSLSHYQKILLLSFLLSATFISCRRDEVNDLTNNSPAAQIAASEKLAIPAEIQLPANLPNGNTRVATFYAEGVQKYKASEITGSNPIAYEWVFVAPQADLYNSANTKIGTHSAGPTWQLSALDSIYGQQFSPAKKAPGSDAGSIDWLLLKPKTGTTPTGVFANVSYIQRIATKGGKAPATPPANANETVDVKYKAVYRFTKINQ
jgi:Protein of unknown function (DUF3455)